VKNRAGRKRAAEVPHGGPTPDANAFAREMADVTPLAPDPRGKRPALRRVTAPRVHAPSTGDQQESDEAFAAHGIDRREIRRLTRGEYFVDDRRDVHGMTADDACASVKRFLESSRHKQHRCVCIVHGRGLHSEGNVPVLKIRVRECLRSHRSVLAYADAPRSDGGAGAVYVLLRKSAGGSG
jgi:DNA-nicking Smr family endonuclease